MAVTPFKTFVSGEVLTASDLNSSITTITNGGMALISPATVALDMDGFEFILDADADSSITADTDDQFDFKLSGTDYFRMTAGRFMAIAAAIVEAEGVAVASAATTDIWANDGNTVHVTGTTTITSFGTAPQAGAWKKVIFDGALTLTHGANLSLPGSANITTAADDIAFVYADTTTQFDVLYFKKDGTAVAGGTWTGGTATSDITMSSSMLIEAEGAAVASAATTDIWATDGNTRHITGTTTITSFGTAPQAGAWMKVIFDGALTLTHGANLSLPGSANITTAADDFAFVYADTTTQFDVLYFKKSGAATTTASQVQILGGLGGQLTAGSTGYMTIGGGAGTEAEAQFPVPYAGTLDLLYVKLSAAPTGAETMIMTARKNGADQTVTTTITGAATTGNDTSNSFTVAAGDLINVKRVASAGAATSFANWSMRFTKT